ncbi:MAG: hypothetical protein HW401_279 [Parcubacteria group bacterium]|nr:hypothetical protein [Parcubacteria group bacterium]
MRGACFLLLMLAFSSFLASAEAKGDCKGIQEAIIVDYGGATAHIVHSQTIYGNNYDHNKLNRTPNLCADYAGGGIGTELNSSWLSGLGRGRWSSYCEKTNLTFQTKRRI